VAVLVALALLALTGCTGGPASPSVRATPTTVVPAPGDNAALTRFYQQHVTWHPCGGSDLCTRIRVPLNYREPQGRSISLALLEVPATGQAQGSLLVNPGGPGVSGVDYARSAPTAFTAPVRDHFNIVGWDPRGVDRSAPVNCVGNAQLDKMIAADGTPDTNAQVRYLLQLQRSFVRGCEQHSGWLLPYIGTTNSARDMDIIRAVLGEPKLDYLGASYGTLLGATYANLFPQRVGRFVLDGALDPTIDSQQLGRLQAVGFENALTSFINDCIASSGCPVGPTLGDALQQVETLLAKADQTPLPTGTSRPLTEALATTGILAALYNKQYGWPALRQGLSEALADNGATLLKLADLYTERNPNGTFASNVNQAFPAISCTDEPTNLSVARIAHDSLTWQRSAPIFGESFAWGQYTCAIWPLPPKHPEALTAKGAPPILVIGTTRDPATPYEWAVALAHQLDSGVLLTRNGDGHTGYNVGNACVDSTVEQFLINDVVPPNGKTC